MRRSHDAIGAPNLRPCPEVRRLCASRTGYVPECGSYKGEVIVEKKVKIKE